MAGSIRRWGALVLVLIVLDPACSNKGKKYNIITNYCIVFLWTQPNFNIVTFGLQFHINIAIIKQSISRFICVVYENNPGKEKEREREAYVRGES